MAAAPDLERDLHDGAQQRLLAVSAALSRARLSTGPAADAALDETRDELRRAIADLRDLARGVHPALLSQGGLSAAVADLAARSALTVRTDVAPGRWPAAVEATAYFLVCEALNNVEKHAPGSCASVSVQPRDGRLRVQISDDGPGGARPDGHGLRGLTDRASAIGGSARIDSPAGAGTTITVTLPCD
jgi:signal transduction histidine kinase